MGYTFEVEKLAPQKALVIRARVRQEELSGELARILPEVFQFALSEQAGVAGMPFARYIVDGPEDLEIEAGVPVALAVKGNGRIVPIELTGGPTAITTHYGPYSGLPGAREAVRAWLRVKGKSAADPLWEEYISDPADEPDPAKWETRLCQPIL